MKKKLAILLAGLMTATLFSGCVKQQDENESITLKYVMPGPGIQQDSNKVWEAFNEKLHEYLPNVSVEFDIFPLADYKQQVMLMQAGKEQLDIVNTYSLNFSTEIDNGSFASMNELLDDYGKEMRETLPEWLWDYMTVDGEIYGVPSYQMLAVQNAILLPKKYADKYFDKEAFEEDLYSNNYATEKQLDIMEDYLAGLYAEGNIQYGFYHWNLLPYKGYETLASNFAIDIHSPEHNVVYTWALPEMRRAFERYASWYQKGYIRKDSLSANDATMRLGNENGYVLWDETWDPWTEENYKNKNGFLVESVPHHDKYYIPSSNIAGGTAISSSSKYKEEAMQVINLLQTNKELFNLLVYGIEGEHYTKIDDNKIETPYGGQGTSNDKYGIYKWIVGNTSLAYYTQDQHDGYNEWCFEEVNKSEWRSPLIGFTLDTTNIQNQMAQIDAIKGEYLNSVASGSLPNWEEVYNEWMEKAKIAGMDDVIKEIQRQVDEFIASKK